MAPQITGPRTGNITTAQPAPPPTVDATTIALDSLQFKALPAAYKTAVTEAKAFAAKHFRGMDPAPQVLVTSSAGNGSAPVTVIVPPGAKDPLRVHTHYHGDRAGSVSGENAAADKIGAQVKAGDKTIYVLPEAQNRATPTDWKNATDINQVNRDALRAAGMPKAEVDHATLSVHSAGGRALANATRKGETLDVQRIVIQDALYDNDSGTGAYSSLRKQLPSAAKGAREVIIVPSADDSVSGPRARQLAQDLRDTWVDAKVAPTAPSHGQAAAVFELPPARRRAFDQDGFSR